MSDNSSTADNTAAVINREIRSHGIAVAKVANELLIIGQQERSARLSEAAGEMVDLAEKLEKRRQQRASSCLPRGWVVIDTGTGAIDGVYPDQHDANSALERMKARFPGGSWFLFALHSDGDGDVIPDAMFWRNRLGAAGEA